MRSYGAQWATRNNQPSKNIHKKEGKLIRVMGCGGSLDMHEMVRTDKRANGDSRTPRSPANKSQS